MIRYQEVRAGNWVHCKYDSPISPDEDKQLDPLEVYSIWEQDKEKWECEWMYGIPINEQWLLKSGFLFDEYHETYVLFKDEDMTLHYDILPNMVTLTAGIKSDSSRDMKLIFIHQLQNLYFALTGEEL